MAEPEQKVILLVEDQALIALAEKQTLERNGYQVIVASSGEDAIAVARANQAIDLILMDIDLGPGIDGTEAAQAILVDRDVPLAFLSAHTEAETVTKTEGITSYGYIVKHSGDTVLLASIRMAFRLHDAHMELKRRKEHLDHALIREEHAVEELRAKSEELDEYFRSSLDMLCIATADDGRFIRLNPQWESVLGYPLTELEGRPFLDFVHPDDVDRTRLVTSGLSAQQEVVGFENRYRCRDGSYRWIEWRSRSINSTTYAAARDVTDRKRAEDAHRRSEALLRNLMENSIDAVYLLDEHGRFLEGNQVGCEMIGYTLDELLTMCVADIDPNYPAEGFAQFWSEQPEKTSVLFETLHRHKVGHIIPVEVNGIFFRLDGQRLLFGVARDISARKREEAARTEIEQRIRFALETTGIGAWDLDLVDHTAVRTLRHDQIFGYDNMLREWTYEIFIDHVHPDDRDYVDGRFRAAIASGGNWSFQCRIIRVDGVERWIAAAGRHVVDQSGEARRMAGIVQDITDRRSSVVRSP